MANIAPNTRAQDSKGWELGTSSSAADQRLRYTESCPGAWFLTHEKPNLAHELSKALYLLTLDPVTCSVLPRGLRRPLAGVQTAGQHSAGTLPAWGAGILPPAHRHWPRAAHALCLSLPICKMVVITVPIGSGHSENCMFSQNEVLGAPCMLGERGVLLLRRSCGCLAASHSGGRDFVRTDAGPCRLPAVWPRHALSLPLGIVLVRL